MSNTFEKVMFAPIFKVDVQKREVYGCMAEEEKDRSGEIFDYATSKPYVKAWSEAIAGATGGKSYGNVRGQHGKIAAGKLIGITFDDDNRRIPIVAKIVDSDEWQKVLEGVYTGFSIGGSYINKWNEGSAVRYTAAPTEVSIVDNPCMRGAAFTLVKADGGIERSSFPVSTGARSFAEVKSSVNAQLAEINQSIAQLGKVVDAYIARKANFQPLGAERHQTAAEHEASGATVLKFVAGMPGGPVSEQEIASMRMPAGTRDFVTKDAVVEAELSKALANGTPVGRQFKPGGVEKAEQTHTPGRFQAVETVAPGVQMPTNGGHTPNVQKTAAPASGQRRAFQPGGVEDLEKADTLTREALANGKRVGKVQ